MYYYYTSTVSIKALKATCVNAPLLHTCNTLERNKTFLKALGTAC